MVLFPIARDAELKFRQNMTPVQSGKTKQSPKTAANEYERFEKSVTNAKKKKVDLDEDYTEVTQYSIGSQRARKQKSTKEDILFVIRQKCKFPECGAALHYTVTAVICGVVVVQGRKRREIVYRLIY